MKFHRLDWNSKHDRCGENQNAHHYMHACLHTTMRYIIKSILHNPFHTRTVIITTIIKANNG